MPSHRRQQGIRFFRVFAQGAPFVSLGSAGRLFASLFGYSKLFANRLAVRPAILCYFVRHWKFYSNYAVARENISALSRAPRFSSTLLRDRYR